MLNLKTIALGAVIALGMGGAASASTFTDCVDFGTPDITNRVSTAVGCEVMQPDTQDFIEPVMTVNEDGGFFGISTWKYVTRLDPAPAPGAYDFSSLFDGLVGDVLVVFKGGTVNLVGYLLNTSALAGTWSNPFTDPPFSLPGQSTIQGVSHITIYSNVAPIPLPAAGFLMLGALGALGVAARRRKA